MSRSGAALASVLLAIALCSALAVGSVQVARHAVGGARLSQAGVALSGPLEQALLVALAQWDTVARGAQPVGNTAAPAASWIGDVEVTLWTSRLGERTWWLVAQAERPGRPRLLRRAGLLVAISEGIPVAVPLYGWAQLP